MKNTIILLVVLICTLTSGCITSVTVDPVKSWEGHYMTTNDFYQATQNIQLDKNESIWVLSDKTLNRVLKNIERK